MYLAYFDESGDTGVTKSPTTWFVIGAVLVHETVWAVTLDALVTLRRRLRDTLGISPREELKAGHFQSGRGPFSHLNMPHRQRMSLYRSLLQFQSKLPVECFAVAVHKPSLVNLRMDVRTTAWTIGLQVLQRHLVLQDERAVLFPDEGNGRFLNRLVRRLRPQRSLLQYGITASQFGSLRRILEDPSDRRSHDSHFVPLADLNAYAAHRSPAIDARDGVPANLWDQLRGRLRDVRVSDLGPWASGIPGIVKYP